MKKLIFTISLIVLPVLGLFAQLYSVGPKIGMNITTMTNLLDKGEKRNALYGFSGGISGRIRFDDLYLVAELNFEQKGYHVNIGGDANHYEEMRNNYYEMPILLRYNTFSATDWDGFLEGGIYNAYWTKGTITTSNMDKDGSYAKNTQPIDLIHPVTDELYAVYDFGIIAGGGFSRIINGGDGEICLDMRASYGFLSAVQYTGTESTIRSSGSNNLLLNFSLSYYFNNFDKQKHIRSRHGPYY